MLGTVFDIRRFCVHDGPGVRTTVFLKGCPLTCGWCHNPEGRDAALRLQYFADKCLGCGDCVRACPHQALTLGVGAAGARITIDHDACRACGACVAVCPSEALALDGRVMTAAAVVDAVLADADLLRDGGGVTLSGGEPLAQPEFAAAILSGCRAAGLNTAIETSLAAPAAVIERLLPLIDHWLCDLKHDDEATHQGEIGIARDVPRTRLAQLAAAGADITARIPLIPGVNDDDATVAGIAKHVAEIAPQARVELMPFNPLAAAKYRRAGAAWPYGGWEARQDDARLAQLRAVVTAAGAVPA